MHSISTTTFGNEFFMAPQEQNSALKQLISAWLGTFASLQFMSHAVGVSPPDKGDLLTLGPVGVGK